MNTSTENAVPSPAIDIAPPKGDFDALPSEFRNLITQMIDHPTLKIDPYHRNYSIARLYGVPRLEDSDLQLALYIEIEESLQLIQTIYSEVGGVDDSTLQAIRLQVEGLLASRFLALLREHIITTLVHEYGKRARSTLKDKLTRIDPIHLNFQDLGDYIRLMYENEVPSDFREKQGLENALTAKVVDLLKVENAQEGCWWYHASIKLVESKNMSHIAVNVAGDYHTDERISRILQKFFGLEKYTVVTETPGGELVDGKKQLHYTIEIAWSEINGGYYSPHYLDKMRAR